MGKRIIEAVEWTCDGCGKTETVPVDLHADPPVNWLTGDVVLNDVKDDWVAHQRSCIKKAVERVINSDAVDDQED